MIGQLIDFKTANKITNANKQRLWTPTGKPGSGFERASMDFPCIYIKPKFKISPSAKFFTIGSCFAREVEGALARNGVNSITNEAQVPGNFYTLEKNTSSNGALNVYTPASMRDIIVNSKTPINLQTGSLQLDDKYCDMLLSGLRLLSLEEFQYVRDILNKCYAKLDDADVVVLTLGYTEAWWDTQCGMYVNRSPAGSLATIRHGDRYQFHNMSAPQVIDHLNTIVSEINIRTNNRASIIFTTSPIPLHGTFTDLDVISANTYSKSTLLSAAVYVASQYSHVDYFPSFEMINQMEKKTAFDADGIHVKRPVVDKIMAVFTESYF